MAQAYDATSGGESSAGATSLTFSHTCTGSNLLLLVGFSFVDTASRTISSITYNGVAMTVLYEVNPGGNRRTGMAYLLAPATGAHNVVITASGAVSHVINGISASYTGVKQTGFPDSNASNSSAGSGTITTSTTTVLDNCWLAGIGWSNESTPAISAGANTTMRGTQAGTYGYLGACDSNAQKTPAGSYSLAVGVTTNGYLFVASFGIAETTSIKTVNGLAYASVKTVNDLAIASVKTVNGLA